jgi:hypothetical protein
MFFLSILVLSLLVALIRGGRLARLAHVPFRGVGFLVGAILLQGIVAGFRQPLGIPLTHGGETYPLTYAGLLYLLSLLLLLATCWQNRHLPGLPLIMLGLASNTLVIALNGGHMPVLGMTPADLAARGQSFWSNYIPMTEITRLNILGDYIRLPLPPSVPPAVLSPGDVVIAAGIITFTQITLRREVPYATTPPAGNQ